MLLGQNSVETMFPLLAQNRNKFDIMFEKHYFCET